MALTVSEMWTAIISVLYIAKGTLETCINGYPSHRYRYSILSHILDRTLHSARSRNLDELRMSVDCAVSYLLFFVEEELGEAIIESFLIRLILAHLKFLKTSAVPELESAISDFTFSSLFDVQPDAVADVTERVAHCRIPYDPLPGLPEYIVAQFDAEQAQMQFAQEDEPPNANDSDPEEADSSDSEESDFYFLSSDSFYNAQQLFPDWPDGTVDYKIFLYALRHRHFAWARSWLLVPQETRDRWVIDINTQEDTEYYDGVRLDKQRTSIHDVVSWICYFHECFPHAYNYNRIHTLIPMIFAYNPWTTWSDGFQLPRVVFHKNIFIDDYFKSGHFWETKFAFKFSLMLYDFMDIPMTFSML